MIKNERLRISDIYIGYESKDIYDEVYDEYVEYTEFVMLSKMDYCFKVNDKNKVQIFRNVYSGELLYLKYDNSVFHSSESPITCENHFIDDVISVEQLLEKVKNSDRVDSNYRKHIMTIYNIIIKNIKNKEFINYEDLEAQLGNICALYIYNFNYLKEEDYEELFPKKENKVLDFESYKRKLRKK